ncbi:MAG: tRNA (N6-isopentenyl adenosine(37)-C2)-methylthiotransferase MiaB [Chloroflexi bacterium]|nr:tRNA (N6-isopentenyl adenosine(37)-C2)-methylthiotransferase MiaB [Chloroflexota bacterium]
MKKYHIWTIGCQMNEADSQRLASELEKFGLESTTTAEEADVIVLNTCVVRQSAEDKAYGRLTSLMPVKRERPETIIGLMGCLVGVKDPAPLRKRLPMVDVFLPPSDPAPMVQFLRERLWDEAAREIETNQLWSRYQEQDGELILPQPDRGRLVSAHVPIIYGCDHVCTFCIIPYRRGRERSRPVAEIVREVQSLVEQGIKEVTLLGQIVDRYGYDRQDTSGLPNLLRQLHGIDGLERIRFLTSHPSFMTDELLDTVADLPKVMEHIEVPVQAGNDTVLSRMKRGYTVDQYRALIRRIREKIPGTAIHTDIIVGFPGETEAQFQGTYDLLAELKLDKAHLAMFSPRPNTVAAKVMVDDVPPEEKKRRLHALDQLQAQIATEINKDYQDRVVEVLVEDNHKGKWRGRIRTNKLVFFEAPGNWVGRMAKVHIDQTAAWSMQGSVIQ